MVRDDLNTYMVKDQLETLMYDTDITLIPMTKFDFRNDILLNCVFVAVQVRCVRDCPGRMTRCHMSQMTSMRPRHWPSLRLPGQFSMW